MPLNKQKLKEMILYFSDKSKGDPNFGAVKLNKLLFVSDFYSFGKTGKAISGVTYIHLRKGPGPSNLVKYRDELVAEKALEIKSVPRFGYKQERAIAKRNPNLSIFSQEEKEQMDEALEILKDHTAEEASDFTHKWNGWLLTKENEPIPYSSVFVRKLEKVTLADIDWANKVLGKKVPAKIG